MVLINPKALRAEVDEDALWSLQFEDVSISEALEQVKQTTGIKIIRPSRLGNQLITRSYSNKTIAYILKDIFRDMNYALVWSHGEKGIDSVRILALDRVGGAGGTQSSDAARPGIREYPAPGYPARRQAPPTRSVEESEPEEVDSEVSAEQEEEERKEAESKEEEKEEVSSSEESDEEKPTPPRKLPAQSEEEVGKGSEESPSPVGQSKEEESESSSPGEEAPTEGQ